MNLDKFLIEKNQMETQYLDIKTGDVTTLIFDSIAAIFIMYTLTHFPL